MFYDWLSIYQDFEQKLPFISDTADILIDTDTGAVLTERQPVHKVEGSYSTSINVRISGNRITVKGNPSRFNRLDNLFGFSSIDDCVQIYNHILLSLGLPPFTRCTKYEFVTGKDGSHAMAVSDGATITEIHITTNKGVGHGNVKAYINGLSGQRYRNSIPRLHPNGCTLDWLSKAGNAPLVYADVYDKENEINLHQLQKIKRLHGEDSDEFRYLQSVRDFCKSTGIARFEQKLKSRFLRRENLQFWGISDFSKLAVIHNEFLNIDKRLRITKMDYQTIAESLLYNGVCKSTLAANTTANYAFMWMHGQKFDLDKTQVQTHRARLRKIGLDIAEPCDLTRFSPVIVRDTQEITVSNVSMPSWYRKPSTNQLRLAA